MDKRIEQQNYEDNELPQTAIPFTPEEEIRNIVGQIDPANILNNINHSLKGEYYNKEKGEWENVGKELVNDECRGWVISYFNSIMNNASTLGIISETQLNYLMEGVIDTVIKEFRCNLERFGFVPPGKGFEKKEYLNSGMPDTSRMRSVAEMIFRSAFLVFSRSLKGTENNRIFKSLNMNDQLDFNRDNQKSKNPLARLFGR